MAQRRRFVGTPYSEMVEGKSYLIALSVRLLAVFAPDERLDGSAKMLEIHVFCAQPCNLEFCTVNLL
jgi:hypothetical protein